MNPPSLLTFFKQAPLVDKRCYNCRRKYTLSLAAICRQNNYALVGFNHTCKACGLRQLLTQADYYQAVIGAQGWAVINQLARK